MEFRSYYESPIGKIILRSNGTKLTGLDFDTSRFIDKLNSIEFKQNDELEIFKITKNWLDRYFKGEKPNSKDIPIELVGTDFSQKVWKELKSIPYGKTITYGDIAKKVAISSKTKSMSAQAVGHAVGHNPISIIVPCHRVVGANGNLIGYGGGIDKKVALLKLEKSLSY